MAATNLTYASLFADLGAYLEKGRSAVDVSSYAQIPRIINDSEREIVTTLKLKGFERTLIWNLVVGVCIYPKPDRWRETVSMQMQVDSERVSVFTRDYTYVRFVYPNESLTGQPTIYADHNDGAWLFGPTPDDTYPMETKVYQLPKLLSDDNETNWLTSEAPNLLKSLCLRNYALFLGRDDRLPQFDADYTKHLKTFASSDLAKMMDRSAERDGA